jgi:glycosyltransferase involved in cell wall biosynthesis
MESDRVVLVMSSDEIPESLAPADIALIRPPCVVAEGWLEGLRGAAYCDSTVVTAAPLSTLDLPDFEISRFAELAGAVRARSLRVRPRTRRGFSGCAYITRSGLDLVGQPDAGFWARAASRGLSQVLADDVLVHGVASMTSQEEPLARCIRSARQVVAPPLITIDARMWDPQPTGTYRHVRELVAALADARRAPLRVVVGDGARELMGQVDGAELITESEAVEAPCDVVHRPLQISREWELATLPLMGERVIITQHDLIGYRNPAYFPDLRIWSEYQDQTRAALAVADHVVFPSDHARTDALSDDLVVTDRATVISNGVDHLRDEAGVPPQGLEGFAPGIELVLCLGADYLHKNRLFALRMLDALLTEHNWEGRLVFAGPWISPGGSADEERSRLAADERLRAHCMDLGTIRESEKAWLYRASALVLYPTTYEGFGFIPFEAALYDVPTMWAASSSLKELLGAEDPPISAWEPKHAASTALTLMRSEKARQANLARVRAAAVNLTWQATAKRHIDLYARVSAQPRSQGGALIRLRPESSISHDALRLVGAGGSLPREFERPLLALTTHPRIGSPVLEGIRLGYRVLRRMIRLAGSRSSRD